MAQPLHPAVVPRLDPAYVEFHNEHIINIVPPHTLPWHPSIRSGPAVPGASEPLQVGSTKDYDLSHCKVRVFTPPGNAPSDGWPALLYFHGGKSLSYANSYASMLTLPLLDRWVDSREHR